MRCLFHRWALGPERSVADERKHGHRFVIVQDRTCVDCGKTETRRMSWTRGSVTGWHQGPAASCDKCWMFKAPEKNLLTPDTNV